MKPQKSTGLGIHHGSCWAGWALWGSGLGFCGSGRVGREADMAEQEGIVVPGKDWGSQLHGERGYKEMEWCRTWRAQELQPGAAAHGEAARFTVLRRGMCCFLLQCSPLACRALMGETTLGRSGEVWVWGKSLQVCLVLLESGPNYGACRSQWAQWEHRVQTQS